MSGSYSDIMISNIWSDLEEDASQDPNHTQRKYRRLDLEKETGIRLGCVSPGIVWEMLIEAGKPGEMFDMDLPEWKGMGFEIISLDVPSANTSHIRLFLEHKEYRDIFVAICADLIRSLDECLSNESRRKEISDFLARWSRFFRLYGQEGLSPERQRGLFGELWWLRRLIEGGIPDYTALDSWKGCERGFHDFDIRGYVVEVKTTMTKEPRKVQVSNERQLDERGLNCLHLFVATLKKHESGGQSLPELVKSLRDIFSGKGISYKFEHSLTEAGYLDLHSHIYRGSYTVIIEELFWVHDGFPRITDFPKGIGDLHYSIVLGACDSFRCDILEYLKTIKEFLHAD